MPTRLAIATNQVSSVPPAVFARTSWQQSGSEERIDRDNLFPMTGPVMHFTQDSEIYGEGDAAEGFFKVVSGVVRTCKFLNDGRRQIDAFHVAGDVFGFEAGKEYRLSAEAVSDCTVVSYRRRGLDKLAADNSALSQQLFFYAIRNMTRAQDHSLLLGRKSAVEKVAAFLMEWAQHSPGTRTVTLAMTRQDIADYLGLTIETVSRTLSHLERGAVIELPTARQIRLKNPAALRDLNA
jgi:CRP/FNR family nitrogen fixation transcriptional regulator